MRRKQRVLLPSDGCLLTGSSWLLLLLSVSLATVSKYYTCVFTSRHVQEDELKNIADVHQKLRIKGSSTRPLGAAAGQIR